MADTSKEARARADARFKRSQNAAREGAEAAAQYEAEGKAVRERTAKLKALRVAQEAKEAKEAAALKAEKKKPVKKKKAVAE